MSFFSSGLVSVQWTDTTNLRKNNTDTVLRLTEDAIFKLGARWLVETFPLVMGLRKGRVNAITCLTVERFFNIYLLQKNNKKYNLLNNCIIIINNMINNMMHQMQNTDRKCIP